MTKIRGAVGGIILNVLLAGGAEAQADDAGPPQDPFSVPFPSAAVDGGAPSDAGLPSDAGKAPGQSAPPVEADSFYRPSAPLRYAGPVEFLERNYIFYNTPAIGPALNKPLFLEAQIVPQLFFYNGLKKLPFPRNDRWLNVASFVFIVRFRMVQDDSTPVRPPSYMPRFNYQLFRLSRASDPIRGDRLTMIEGRATLGHHSNGQQYCRYDEHQLMSPWCAPLDLTKGPDLSQLNVRSGDFSTDYIQAAIHVAFLKLDVANYEKRRLSLGVVGEINALWLGFLPGNIDEEEYASYGPKRIRAEGQWAYHFDGAANKSPCLQWLNWANTGTLRVDGSGDLFSKTAPGVSRYRTAWEMSYSPDVWDGLGVFVRYFQGQDYMNILYLEPAVHTVQYGIVWNQSPRVAYRIQSGP